jgi:hypothetical protein
MDERATRVPPPSARGEAAESLPLSLYLAAAPIFLTLLPSPSSSLHLQQAPVSAPAASKAAPKPVLAAPKKVGAAVSAAVLSAALCLGAAQPAAADVSGLTKCSESKQFASRQKKEIKALQKRLKQVGLCVGRVGMRVGAGGGKRETGGHGARRLRRKGRVRRRRFASRSRGKAVDPCVPPSLPPPI